MTVSRSGSLASCLLAISLSAACSTPATPSDAATDTARADVSSIMDVAITDTNVTMDVEAPDTTDAAPPDDVPIDAPIDVTYSPTPANCTEALDAIYTTPTDLPAERGALVHCSTGMQLSAMDAQTQAEDSGATIMATSGVQIIKLAYRTLRGDGSTAVTTATAYLPLVPREQPVPVVLVARSTSGLADRCAPSHEDVPLGALALPFAALGYAVIAPDFSGLGNEGTHLYLDNREAATQLFDGVSALNHLLGPVVGDPVIAIGYSQGGGIVLSAQALEQTLTGRHALRSAVAIAPEWPIRPDSFGYVRVLRNPDQLTVAAGLSSPTVTVMRHYGWFTEYLGASHAGDSFPAAQRASITSEIESLCTVPLGGALDANQQHLRDLVDDSFRLAMLACIDGTPGCVEPATSFHRWLTANVVTADPGGASVLIVQGLLDQVMPAASEAACDVAKLRAEGVEPDICADSLATHDTILERKIEHAITWSIAVATGGTRPTCANGLPACSM